MSNYTTFEQYVILRNLIDNLRLEKADRTQSAEDLALANNHFVDEVDVVTNGLASTHLHVIQEEDDLEPRRIKQLVNANITMVKRFLDRIE